MYLHRIIGCALFLSLAVWKLAIAQCAVLNERSPAEDLIAFLRASNAPASGRQDRECIQFALEHLEYKSSPDAISTLIDFLDFERPLSEAERDGFVFHGPRRFIGGYYAATSALYTFGKDAVPELLSAIKSRKSPLIRRNATYTIMQIFRTQPVKGIEALKQEVQISPSASANLREAISVAGQWCYENIVSSAKQLPTRKLDDNTLVTIP